MACWGSTTTGPERHNENERHSASVRNRLAYLDVQALVVGAGGQQEAMCGVGELTVVDLLFVLLLEGPHQLGSLYVPHLTDAISSTLGQSQVDRNRWADDYLLCAYLHFPVAGAGCNETVVRGESTAEHLIIVIGDLCELLTWGASKHLSAQMMEII